MVDLPTLAVYYIEKYLLLDAEDTTVQACKYHKIIILLISYNIYRVSLVRTVISAESSTPDP